MGHFIPTPTDSLSLFYASIYNKVVPPVLFINWTLDFSKIVLDVVHSRRTTYGRHTYHAGYYPDKGIEKTSYYSHFLVSSSALNTILTSSPISWNGTQYLISENSSDSSIAEQGHWPFFLLSGVGCSVYSYYELCLSCQITGSYWLAHPEPQLCGYREDIIVHIDT